VQDIDPRLLRLMNSQTLLYPLQDRAALPPWEGFSHTRCSGLPRHDRLLTQLIVAQQSLADRLERVEHTIDRGGGVISSTRPPRGTDPHLPSG
jgi:hypothetical protein